MDDQKREKRSVDSRELSDLRPKRWTPPQLLPEPDPEDGYTFYWVRISTLNRDDPVNISSKFREGWEPVKASSQPRMRYLNQPDSRFPDGIQIGGLLLCKTPVELVEQRNAYFQEKTQAFAESVDNNYMRESHPLMPMFKDKRSKVSFGKSS